MTLVAIVAAGSSPILAATGVEWLGLDDVERVLHGEDVEAVAQDIARREFGANASLEILEVWDESWTTSEWGDKLRANPNDVYRHVRVRIVNEGKLDLAVHTSHFQAIDDIGRSVRAEWGLAHGFDTPSLPRGADEVGVLVFEMREYARIDWIEWRGAFAEARAAAVDPTNPRADEGAAPSEPAPDAKPPQEAAPPEAHAEEESAQPTADDYASHWEG